MNKKFFITVLTVMGVLFCKPQLLPKNNIEVSNIQNPWTGGMDLPQFSNADINQDGVDDLIIFDRKVHRFTVFIKQSDGSYIHNAAFSEIFPNIERFALFRDYNCDGLADIFAFVNTGIQVFRQEIVSGKIEFVQASSLLTFDLAGFQVNIYNSNGDIPAIEDVDGDGDIDIASFSSLGAQLPFFRNMSVENGYGCDSLQFIEYSSCYGAFQESSSSNSIVLDVSCNGGPGASSIPNTLAPKHVGSTVLFFDPNEDNKMDLLIGDIAYSSMAFLQNDMTSLDAHISSFDATYPSFDQAIDVEIFPAAYYLDVTNDGKKDLIVSPNATTTHVNKNVAWLYENTGNPTTPFSFIKDNFMIDEMIDVGSYSAPFLFDHNGDDLLDLLVANGFSYNSLGNVDVFIEYYENIGTQTEPAFELITSDYQGLNSLGIDFMRPAFGDLDNDGDEDMIIGDSNGFLHYFENSAGAGNEASFSANQLQYFNIDVGNKAHPVLFDLNKDGLLDLIIGQEGSYGEISYFWNFGTTTNPIFSMDSVNSSLGKIRTNMPGFIPGYSAPFVLETDTGDIIMLGSDIGNISVYAVNLDSLYAGSFEFLKANILNKKGGIRTTLTAADIDHNDTLDFFIGNASGGLLLFGNDGVDSIEVAINDKVNKPFKTLHIYPNPSSKYLYFNKLNCLKDSKVKLISVLGKTVFEKTLLSEDEKIDISNLPNGIYNLLVETKQCETFVNRIIKK